jgi:hypothetical protein
MNARVAWAVLAIAAAAGIGFGFWLLWSGQKEIAERAETAAAAASRAEKRADAAASAAARIEQRLSEPTARPGVDPADSPMVPRSVAVVPVGDPPGSYDGHIGPALVTKLVEVGKVEVVPLSRVEMLRSGETKPVKLDAQGIGRRLGAQYVLTFKTTQNIHVHVELLRADTGLLVWSDVRQLPSTVDALARGALQEAAGVAKWVKEKVDAAGK